MLLEGRILSVVTYGTKVCCVQCSNRGVWGGAHLCSAQVMGEVVSVLPTHGAAMLCWSTPQSERNNSTVNCN